MKSVRVFVDFSIAFISFGSSHSAIDLTGDWINSN